ncbi:(d)CMP kinase [Bacteroidetes/Chlorobi group bacterium Naka2016]|jgi:cytidylate kinase|nr:MAG: (d)CMP kinase [Bacteroidetes/Chlorobi group bacterium Naka2016]
MKKGIIIAIDGPAGSGKSTTAKLLAQKLRYKYIDTGAMYRAVTLFWLRKNLPLEEKAVCQILPEISIDLQYNNNGLSIFLNGEDVSEAIRLPEVTNFVSPISTFKCVREFLVEQQRTIGANGAVVMDGRDIGTVVFPNADLKIFLVASVEERVRRRLLELKQKGVAISPEEVRMQIIERDRIDSTRQHSPLQKALDAIEIDTTNLTIEEQVEKIYHLAIEKINNQKN